MTSPVFIRSGHGYEKAMDGTRCDAFDGFEIVAAPLHQEGDGWQSAFGNEARAKRVYYRDNGRGGTNGTDYGSHAIKLGKDQHGDLHILMQHGSGREVWRIPQFFDGGDLAAHIVTMPERLQYSLLYTIWKTARAAIDQGKAETRQEWAQAIHDGRIRKRRATKTRGPRVEMIPQWEIDLKQKADA